MYLAKKINEILESKKDLLIGNSSYVYICKVLNNAFKQTEPFKFKYETYSDYGLEDYAVSGLYNQEEDIKYIILNFSSTSKSFKLEKSKWKEFKFSISQVCQHETIHQCQWSRVSDPGLRAISGKLEFRNVESTIEQDQEYLSDLDEIDAYAHDIAMEIAYFYPKKNPYQVLKDINRYKKIWSYNYYKKTFKNEDWLEIKNRLLKKTYMWIPHVHI